MSRVLIIGSCIVWLMCIVLPGHAQSRLPNSNHRFVLLFSPDGQNQSLLEQSKMLRQAHAGVADRNMVIVQVVEDNVEIIPSIPESLPTATALREAYHIQPEKFTLILVGKDGSEKYRAPHAQAPAVLFNIIDEMPMRQEEVKRKPNN